MPYLSLLNKYYRSRIILTEALIIHKKYVNKLNKNLNTLKNILINCFYNMELYNLIQ